MILQSTITCPHCRNAKTETMPTDACQFFYECTRCGTRLKAKPGDCCVFCSYGSIPCPPMQAEPGLTLAMAGVAAERNSLDRDPQKIGVVMKLRLAPPFK
jgi:hypothetical protein